MKYLIKSILEIAKENHEGFTINIESLEFVTDGYSVAYKETQDSFDIEGLEKVIIHSLQNDLIVGGWLNEDNNYYYFDSCKIFQDLQQALSFARENEQIAIFDLTNLEVIKV